jgi:hypothetical protein
MEGGSMMGNRIADHAQTVRDAIAAGRKVDGSGTLDASSLPALDASLAVDFAEHAAYQTAQARAHASGKITTEEAFTVYAALGEIGSAANGGWAQGTDLALKVTVTTLIGQLIGAKS